MFRKLIKRFAPGTKGMTLIEIMVVITIIGLVATMFTVNVMGRMKKAKIKTAGTQIKSIEQALEQYYLDEGEYPSSEDGLGALADLFKGGKVPKDAWKKDFVYMSPGPDGEDFVVISPGPDGKEGTDDDIKSSELE